MLRTPTVSSFPSSVLGAAANVDAAATGNPLPVWGGVPADDAIRPASIPPPWAADAVLLCIQGAIGDIPGSLLPPPSPPVVLLGVLPVGAPPAQAGAGTPPAKDGGGGIDDMTKRHTRKTSFQQNSQTLVSSWFWGSL